MFLIINILLNKIQFKIINFILKNQMYKNNNIIKLFFKKSIKVYKKIILFFINLNIKFNLKKQKTKKIFLTNNSLWNRFFNSFIKIFKIIRKLKFFFNNFQRYLKPFNIFSNKKTSMSHIRKNIKINNIILNLLI